jgi:hypothetical protein
MCIWGEWNTHVIWKTFIWLLLKACEALYIYNLWLTYLLLVLLEKARKYIPTFMIACEYTNCSFYPCIKFLYLGLIALIYLRTEPNRTEPNRKNREPNRTETEIILKTHKPNRSVRFSSVEKPNRSQHWVKGQKNIDFSR